jgi:uncharacterized protein (TIGR03083 family)
MELATYLDQLSADGALLAATVEDVSFDAGVRSCPGWTVRDLITHIGGVHRWAASIVGNAMLDNDEVAGDQVGTGPDDATLIAWFREGHQALLQTLRAAPSDLRCFTFLPAPTPLLFWARRQAHETAIHRVDAQTVAGEISAFGADFAGDGIEEILFGFAARPRPAIEPGMMLVKPDDLPTAWLLTFGDPGVAKWVGDADADVDAVLTGSAADLYRWLWNRPSAAVLSGDESVADRWHGVRVRWS